MKKSLLLIGMISLCFPTMTNVKAESKVEISSICTKVSIASKGSYTLGDKYSCDPGDGTKRDFYVLDINENEISLIMDSNIGNTVAWSADGNTDNGPVTALSYLKTQTSNWSKVSVSMPSYDQIYRASGNQTSHLSSWLWENLHNSTNNLAYGYWTASPYLTTAAYVVSSEARLRDLTVTITDAWGVRPVITVLKDTTNDSTITDNNGNTTNDSTITDNNGNTTTNMTTDKKQTINKTTTEKNPNTLDLNIYELLSVTCVLLCIIGIVTKKYKKI